MLQSNKSRDVSELVELVSEITAYWKEIARRQFDAGRHSDEGGFEQRWPKTLANFFLAETARVAKALSPLSQNRNN